MSSPQAATPPRTKCTCGVAAALERTGSCRPGPAPAARPSASEGSTQNARERPPRRRLAGPRVARWAASGA
eukprot:11167183-Lingulodinium_polyedra.AAC.1